MKPSDVAQAGQPRLLGLATRLAPLYLNLTIATVLRLALPWTIDASGERHRYYAMSLILPLPDCLSFHCFRVLPPLLASWLPLPLTTAYLVTGWLCYALAGTFLWYIAERLTGSRRVALLTTLWFWATWGPIQSFSDPLLISDPVQAVWSLGALSLLLGGQYGIALPVLISGAAVKESVLLVPIVYAAWVVLARDSVRKRIVWLGVLIVTPIVAWLLLRAFLITQFGYVGNEDVAYLRRTYFFGSWLPNLGPWPHNLLIASLYLFGAFGAAWLLGALGLRAANRKQRALTIASLPAMLVLALLQVPDRALASFPYAVLIPASIYVSPLPTPLTGALLLANAAFTIRMNTAVTWLPRMPVLLVVIASLLAATVWLASNRRGGALRHEPDVEPAMPEPEAIPARLRGVWDGFSSGQRRRLAWTAVGGLFASTLLLGLVVASQHLRSARPIRLALPPDSVAITADDGIGTAGMALSPDGSRIAYVAADRAGVRCLWIRRIEWIDGERLPHTEGVSAPFWSPDGGALGFFADGKLRTVEIATGRVTTLADAPTPRGGAWSPSGTIVFAPSSNGSLYRVPASGGVTLPATALAGSPGPSHLWPAFLPDGRHFFFTVRPVGMGDGSLHVGTLDSTAIDVHVVGRANGGVYVAPGFVVFGRLDGTVWAQPFELERYRIFANEIQLVNRAQTDRWAGRVAFSAGNERLAFAGAFEPPVLPPAELRWIDRAGRLISPTGQINAESPELAPDGRLVAAATPGTREIWLLSTDNQWAPRGPLDAEEPTLWDVRGSRRRISGDQASQTPLFSPDGRRIAFLAAAPNRERYQQLVVRALEESPGVSRTPLNLPIGVQLTSWSPDGRVLLYQAEGRTREVWAVPADGGSGPSALLQGGANYLQARFSPDNKWIAYTSDETGIPQVYVQPYPPTGAKWQVSRDGGAQPRWRGDGRELVFVVRDRALTAVSIDAEPVFHAGTPHRLFEARIAPERPADHLFQYAMTADGLRFLVNTLMAPEPAVPVTVLLDWRAQLTAGDARARYR